LRGGGEEGTGLRGGEKLDQRKEDMIKKPVEGRCKKVRVNLVRGVRKRRKVN